MLAESGVVAGSALHIFSVRQAADAEFGRIKAGQTKRLKMAQKNPRLLTKFRLMCSSVRVAENKATVNLVLNAPEDLLVQVVIKSMHKHDAGALKGSGP